MVIQHSSGCQKYGPSLEPVLMVILDACKQQKCDVRCVQEAHRGQRAVRPRVKVMNRVAEIPHKQ